MRAAVLLAALQFVFILPASLHGQNVHPTPEEIAMPSSTPAAQEQAAPQSILVHITHGPEAPTRAVLGFHVARAALSEGHDVTVFLAGDAVTLLRDATLDRLEGLGTGTMREIYDGFVEDGGRFYLSGGSSGARGLSEAELEGKPVAFGAPADLVRLSVEHDRMFTY